MKHKRRLMLVVAVPVAVLLIGGLFGVARYARSVSTWSDSEGGGFADAMADAVADAVTDGVTTALARVDRELAEVSVGNKRLTVADLARLRDLRAAGNLGQVRRELRSRFTTAELQELQHRLEALADQPSPPVSP